MMKPHVQIKLLHVNVCRYRAIYSGHLPPPLGGGEILAKLEKQGRIL